MKNPTVISGNIIVSSLFVMFDLSGEFKEGMKYYGTFKEDYNWFLTLILIKNNIIIKKLIFIFLLFN